jgi:hypothetical protein
MAAACLVRVRATAEGEKALLEKATGRLPGAAKPGAIQSRAGLPVRESGRKRPPQTAKAEEAARRAMPAVRARVESAGNQRAAERAAHGMKRREWNV